MRAYEYTMQYQPGKEHMNANCFSRLPLPVTEAAGPEDRVLMIEELEDCSVLSAEISEWTRRDPVLAHVHEYPLRGWPSDDKSPDLAAYRVQKDELSVQDGCVLRGAQVVIPQQGPQQVMSELHAAYLGINRMKRLAGSYVCGLGWTVILRTWSISAPPVKNTSMPPVAAPLHPWEFPDGPWKRIHVDYAGPFKGEMLLVAVNAFSKWFEDAIMKQMMSTATIQRLREIFAQHRLLDKLVSNNSTNFSLEEFAEFQVKWHHSREDSPVSSFEQWAGRKGCVDSERRHH